MTGTPHAVVVGAGIGGLAAGTGLTRRGWRVTVLERAARPRESGAGLSLLTNAQRALDALGVGDRVRARAATMAPGGEGLRRPNGRRLQRPADPAFLRDHGISLAVLPRPELHAVLRGALAPGRLRTDAEVVGTADHGGRVRVVLRGRDGPEHLDADVVVAADGVHSTLRSRLWPTGPRPVYSGHSVWRGVARGVDGRAEPGGSTWGRGREFGRMPLAADAVYWFAVANTPAGARFADQHAEVRRRFGSWHHPVPALLDATPPGTVLHHDVLELSGPLPRFVSGRVALLGDAAHAMTSDLGQGACQALEDAAVLAALLDPAGDVVANLDRYDALRRPRSQAVALASRRTGERKLATGWRHAVRRTFRTRFGSTDAARRGLVDLADWCPPAPVPSERRETA